MSLYRDHGIVLRTYRLGEADRIVVLMSEANGQVRAVAKGIRKTGSRFGGRLEPTSHVAVQLYRGRELDVVTQVEIVDHFRAIREHLDNIARASLMLETVDQLSQEREPDPELYRMLLGALRTLAAGSQPLVAPAFLLKALGHAGFGPMVDACVRCGADEPLVAFDLGGGGLVCEPCRQGIPTSPDAVVALQQILGGRLGEALGAASPDVSREVDLLVRRIVEYQLERRLRSTTVLEASTG